MYSLRLLMKDGKTVRNMHPFHLAPASKQASDLYDIYLMLYVQSCTPDDGLKDRPKHVECYYKIK
jgi:hypothetical protein